MAYLDPFVDDELELDHAWTPDAEKEVHLERLLRLCVITLHVKEMKRRLGPDASPAEMSVEKKTAKAVHNRFSNMYRLWGGDDADITETYLELVQTQGDGEEREEGKGSWLREAAQLDWEKFWSENAVLLNNARVRIATHASKLGYRKDGNRMVNLLSNEFNSIDDILSTEISEQ